MKKKGFIESVDHDNVKVIVMRDSACGHDCGSCGGCESKPIELSFNNNKNYSVGDVVDLEISENNYIYLTLLLYAVPLIMFIGGFLISKFVFSKILVYENELIDTVVGFIFLLGSSLIGRAIDKKNKNKEFIKLL